MLTISLILVLTMLSAGELYAQKAQRFRGIQLIGPTSKNQNAQKNQGVALLAPPSMTSSYALVFPQSQGSIGQVLSRGSGDNLAWVSLTDQTWSLLGNADVDSTSNFIGTTNTNANAPLIIKTDGNERMRITGGAGWVGIGVANPAALLDVNGTMRVGGAATLAGTVTMSSVAAGTASDDVLLINASNQVTKVSRADLISAAGWALTGNATTTAWNGTSGSRLGTTSEQPLVLATTNATAQDIRFYTGANGASERMRIRGNGKVGIGVTSPTATFEVQASGSGDQVLHFKNSSGNTVLKSDDLGRVLINTNDAGGWLTVKGSGGNGGNLQLQSMTDVKWEVSAGNTSGPNGTAGFSIWGNFSNISGSGTLRFGIDTNGRTGIGTHTQYDAMLDVRNTVAASNVLNLRGASSQSVNYVTIENNAGLDLITVKSTGALSLEPTGTSAGNTNELRFAELAANGTNYVGFKAADLIGTNRIWTLPAADGTNGQVLSTNGSGVLSWTAALTSTSGWSTTGNTGLNASTNFLGTTDSVDVVFRHFNSERLRMTRHGLRVIQNGTPRSSQWAASFQNIGGPVYLELLNSDTVTNGGGMYMGMRGTGSVGDTATIWNWQGGPLAFYTAPTNRAGFIRLMVDSDGDVGIGSHIPTARLHVRGGNVLIDTVGSTSGQLLFRNPQGTASTGIRAGFQTSDITYWLPATAPSVNGQVLTANTSGVMEWANVSSQSWGLTGNAGTSSSTNFIGTTDANDVVLKRDNTERARITNAGLRVVQNGTPRSSVWTLSVQNILSTNGSTVIEFLNTTEAVNGGGAFVGLNGNGAIGDTLGIWNHQAGPIEFQTGTSNRSNTPRMRIGSNGNVAIGDITGGTLLDVDGAITVRPPATIAVIADNQAVTVGNRSSIVLESNGLPANRTITLSNGLQTGQILFIAVTGTLAANGIEIADDPAGANTNLSGLAQLVDGAVLQLLWNGTDWLEVSRSNN